MIEVMSKEDCAVGYGVSRLKNKGIRNKQYNQEKVNIVKEWTYKTLH